MWIFTRHGFFDIVQNEHDPNLLHVRARVKGDIERYWPEAKVIRTEDADYLYRADIKRDEVAQVIHALIDCINYTSFKSSLEDKTRYSFLVDIAGILIDMQQWKDVEERV